MVCARKRSRPVRPGVTTGFRLFDRDDAERDLPASLFDAIDAAGGGIWWAGDHYADGATIVRRAREVATRALVLDARDLSFLAQLPEVRYLYLRSDGRPVLDPVAALTELEALLLGVGAIRGELDVFSLPRLRWLRLSLGGKGGRAVADRFAAGHDKLEWLSIQEVPFRTIADAAPAFSRLRHLRLFFADHLRGPGDLSSLAPTLRGLQLYLTGIRTLAGLEILDGLDALSVVGGKKIDLAPVGAMPSLRYLQAETGDGVSLEPLRNHPGLRMVSFSKVNDPDLSILDTLRNLVAVGRGPRLEDPTRWPDITSGGVDPLLAREWRRAIGG
ncbi:MAG: hypothetical protein QOI09_1886 [Chloroflexota bacterium]|nr:hypothetical protein [Chloroflexota bacterium]